MDTEAGTVVMKRAETDRLIPYRLRNIIESSPMFWFNLTSKDQFTCLSVREISDLIRNPEHGKFGA